MKKILNHWEYYKDGHWNIVTYEDKQREEKKEITMSKLTKDGILWLWNRPPNEILEIRWNKKTNKLIFRLIMTILVIGFFGLKFYFVMS